MNIHEVTVRVPATTANMGPGFDCLGMALDIYDDITFAELGQGDSVVEGEGMVKSYGQLALHAAQELYKEIRRTAPSFKVCSDNRIPIGRGLGSSAAAIVGGLVAANHLCGVPLSTKEILELAVRIEGHPDNVTPALLGGCRVMVVEEDRQLTQANVPFPPELKAVLFVPDFSMPTEESRRLLPDSLSRSDTVYNVSRAALLVTALATRRLELLQTAMGDRIHQPARSGIFSAMYCLFEAALDAGALGVFLSGGGPTVLALTLWEEKEIGKAMEEAAREEGIRGESLVSRMTLKGAYVE